MKKNTNILSTLLVVSALITTPSIATQLLANAQVKQNSISKSIVNTLYRRGLNKNSAINLANNIFTIDEELFALMLQNLENDYNDITKKEILDFLSNQALMKNTVELDSYSYLINMLYQIKQKPLSKNELKLLSCAATKNTLLLY